MRSRPSLINIGIALLAATALFGCSPSDQKDDGFPAINAAYSDINPSTLGSITFDREFGRAGISSDPPTRQVGLVSTQTKTEVEELVSARLTSAGFTQSSPSAWRRGSGASFVLAITTTLDSGATFPADTGAGSVAAGNVGVVLRLSSQV
jgi:hypothetical protein